MASLYQHEHYNDVIMSLMASQITSLTTVYLTVYSKKTSKLRVTGLCEGNSSVTGEFPAQRASNAENVSIWWRHQESLVSLMMRSLEPKWMAWKMLCIRNTGTQYYLQNAYYHHPLLRPHNNLTGNSNITVKRNYSMRGLWKRIQSLMPNEFYITKHDNVSIHAK